LSGTTDEHLELPINVHGIPLFKSSSSTLRPILCPIKKIHFKKPSVVRTFCVKEKPQSAAEFSAEFVPEACQLIQDGITLGNNHRIQDGITLGNNHRIQDGITLGNNHRTVAIHTYAKSLDRHVKYPQTSMGFMGP